MTTAAAVVLLIEVGSIVAGQVLVKHAVENAKTAGATNSRVIATFAGGVAAMTVSFFLTLALLQHFALSFFFPFQALSVVITVIASGLFLRERLTLRLILGSLLVSIGVALVSTS